MADTTRDEPCWLLLSTDAGVSARTQLTPARDELGAPATRSRGRSLRQAMRKRAVQAIRDVAAGDNYDRVIVSTRPWRVSRWLGRDLPKLVKALGLSVEVITLTGRACATWSLRR